MIEWIISFGVMIVLSSVLFLILPEGKTSSLIKFVVTAITVFVFLSPLKSLDFSSISLSFTQIDSVEMNNSYLNYVYAKKEESDRLKCKDLLEKKEIYEAQIDITYNSDGKSYKPSGISVFLGNAVINSDKEHIVIIEEVKKEISEMFDIDGKDVFISV